MGSDYLNSQLHVLTRSNTVQLQGEQRSDWTVSGSVDQSPFE
jgi:hypothetical protein